MNVSDTITFDKTIEVKQNVDEVEMTKGIGYVSATIDKTNLHYIFNIQIFDKDYYKENMGEVNGEVMNFFSEVSKYMKPNLEGELIQMLAFQE